MIKNVFTTKSVMASVWCYCYCKGPSHRVREIGALQILFIIIIIIHSKGNRLSGILSEGSLPKAFKKASNVFA